MELTVETLHPDVGVWAEVVVQRRCLCVRVQRDVGEAGQFLGVARGRAGVFLSLEEGASCGGEAPAGGVHLEVPNTALESHLLLHPEGKRIRGIQDLKGGALCTQ